MKIRALLTLLVSFASAGAQETVSIAAAANISSVAPSLGAAFAAGHAGYRAEFTFGASGVLVTQILNGAPFELFMSADMAFARKLVDEGLARGPVRAYALGSLVLLTTKSLDLSKGLAVLLDPSIRHVANSNPETAPYGRAALQALVRAGLFDKVRSRLVTAQNVTQALQFTLTAADAGFLNESALYSRELKPWNRRGVHWFAIDPGLYDPIEQGFVVTRAGESAPAAAAFAQFLSSAEARAVFASFGYGAP